MSDTRRRYTRRQKVTAVLAADMTSAQAASESTGIPRTTLARWMEDPEMVALRQKTRDDLAEETKTLAHVALGALVARIRSGDIETKDLIPAFGVAVDKAQLLTGMATSRTESRDLTGTLSDAELISALREADALVAGIGTPTSRPSEAEA